MEHSGRTYSEGLSLYRRMECLSAHCGSTGIKAGHISIENPQKLPLFLSFGMFYLFSIVDCYALSYLNASK